MNAKSDSDGISVSIGRQPIFDNKRKLWGYELFCVGSQDLTHSAFPDNASVAIQVQSSAYVCLQKITEAGKNVVVNFSEKSILDNLPYVLPPHLATLKISEHVGERPAVLETLGRLKSDGYRLAVEGFSANPALAPLYQLADILGLEVDLRHRDALKAVLAEAQRYSASLLAVRVQDETLFKSCRELGFALFHGGFFKSPEHISVRKLSSNESLRFDLLRAIEAGDADFSRLAGMIQSDATISLRLLAYLNSAAFAFSQKVKSVPQAIALIGWENVKKWLRVVLLTDMSQTKETHELVLLSAQRGLFLDLVAREHDFWGFDPESLHLLGLFSLLDALLGVSMGEIVANLPLDRKMKAALCRESNNEYLPLLQLAQHFEEARWEDGERLIQELNLDSTKVKAAFQASIDWATELESVHS